MQPPSFAVLRPGDVFHGRYRVVACMKAGGMGAVYEVVDDNTDSRRALKVMLPGVVEDPDQRARFALEAKVTGNIESDHIVRVSDAGIDDATGAPFLVMELLRGEELGTMLERRRALPADEVVTYISQTALALDKTHAAGIVHRDLKPGNLFVTARDDGSPCVKILDFGIAKVVTRGADGQGTKTLGTPLYMAPEQIHGAASSIGPRTDLYALAHVVYALLAGEPYWKEESQADESLYLMLTKILEGGREPPCARALRRGGVQLPPGFDAWFARMTAVRPDDREGRAGAAVAALADALGVAAPAVSSRAAGLPAAASGALPSPGVAVPGPGTTSVAVTAPSAVAPSATASTALAAPPAPKKSALPVVALIGGLVVIALAATGGVLAATGVFSKPPPRDSALYSDTFDNDKGKWFQPVITGDLVYIDGGKLVVQASANDSFSTWPTVAPITNLRDFTVEVDITRVRGPDTGWCGLVWRLGDTGDGYSGGFNGAGLTGMVRYDAKAVKFKPLSEYKKSAAVKQANGAVNHLKVVVRGAEMSLFVNDQLLERAVDSNVSRGKIGLYVNAGMRVTFDNFRVTAGR
jgi:serine/threonine protein kinase